MLRKSVLPPVLSWYVRSSITPRLANRSVSTRWTMVAPSCALMSSPMIGTPAAAETLGPGGIAGDEDGDVVDEGDAGLERAFGVEFGRLLAADRQIVHHHVDIRRAQCRDNGGTVRLGRLGEHEGAVRLRIVQHMLGDAVQHRPHRHDRAGRLHIGAEDRGAVGLGEDRLGDIAADLAPVHVPRRHHMDVVRAITADLGMEQPRQVVGALPVMLQPLHQRAGAVAYADEGDANRARGRLEHARFPQAIARESAGRAGA